MGGGDYLIAQSSRAEELEPDYWEGIELWEAGEPEDAEDALRFVLAACGDHLEAHVALGKIALRERNDARLARGHFGYAFELVERALGGGFRGRLPRDRAGNVPYFEAGEGLATCYDKLDRPAEAAWVRSRLRSVGGVEGGSRSSGEGSSERGGCAGSSGLGLKESGGSSSA